MVRLNPYRSLPTYSSTDTSTLGLENPLCTVDLPMKNAVFIRDFHQPELITQGYPPSISSPIPSSELGVFPWLWKPSYECIHIHWVNDGDIPTHIHYTYIYIYIYTYIYIYKYIFRYRHIYINIYIYMYTYIYIYIYTCILHMFTFLYLNIYICRYLHKCVCKLL